MSEAAPPRRRRRVWLALLAVVALLWLVGRLLPGGREPSVKPGSALVIELSGEYVEGPQPSLIERLVGRHRHSFPALLSELRKAGRDSRIASVVLRVRPLQIGWGKAEELRNAIAWLRGKGKRTLAYLELPMGANLEYFVATAADQILVSPASAAPLTGLSAEFLFLGGLWEKLGAGVEVVGIGEYKSAAEIFSQRSMSEPHREMAESLLDSTNAQFVRAIAEGRKLEVSEVRHLLDAPPSSPEGLQKARLVDAVSQFDEAIAALGQPPVVESEDYAGVEAASVGFAPKAQLALVYGAGSVVVGTGTTTRSGDPVLASDTLWEVFEDVAKNDEMRAVIFRIDSPGGSPLAADIVWRATRLLAQKGKPLIVSVSDVAASGGYYVAAGAEKIVASPASLLGSIGVFAMRPVLAGALQKLDIGSAVITRGANADLLLASQPLSEGTRAHMKAEIESIYELFLARVDEGRPIDAEAVRKIARGRVWTGEQALERGLVDRLGGLWDAVDEAKRAIGLDAEADVALVPFPRPKPLGEELAEALGGAAARVSSVGPFPLPPAARSLAAWIESLAPGSPSLVPPLVVQIR
jgi:protease-4